MGKVLFFWGVVGALGASSSWAKTVCTATINSADEAELFRKYAPEGTKFVELTEYASESGKNDWFDRACASGIRCDTLVVSGHFGGIQFSGEFTPWILELRDIERHACDQTCDGILQAPRDVYLFGCNTLAVPPPPGRVARGIRDPETYFRHLLHADIPEGHAAQIVAQRYGYAGMSSLAAMKRSFYGVERIYGFYERSPSGRRIRPFLEKYFQEAGEIAWDPGLLGDQVNHAFLKHVNRSPLPHATEVAGLASREEGGEELENICSLRGSRHDRAGKIHRARELLEGKDYSKYLPAIEEIVSATFRANLNAEERFALEALKGSAPARDHFLASIDPLKKSRLLWPVRLDRSLMAEKLGWIGAEELTSRENEAFLSILQKPVTEAEANLVCGYMAKQEFEVRTLPLDAKRFSKLHLKNEWAWKALGCACVQGYEQAAFSRFNDDKLAWNSREAALLYLARLRHKDPEFVRAVLSLYQTGTLVERMAAGYALSELATSDSRVEAYFVDAFLKDADPAFRKTALRSMGGAIRNSRLKAEILRDMEARVLGRKTGEISTYVLELSRAVLRFDELGDEDRALLRRMVNRNPSVRSVLEGEI